MILHLIRHAKTDQFSETGEDFDRKLLPRGKRQSVSLYKYLDKKSWELVQVYCSTAKRTLQTWQNLEAAFPEKSVEFSDKWYLCDLKTYLKSIWETDRRTDLILIGHNFGISDLANYFLDDDREMATCEYMAIQFDIDSWSESSRGMGKLIERFRPDDR